MDGVTNLAESADGWKNAQSGRSVDAPCVLMGSSRIAANKCRSTLPPSLENRDLRLWILPRAARPGNGGHGRIDIDQPHGRMVRKQVSTATGAPLTMTDRGLVVGVGYESEAAFSRAVRKLVGSSPSAWRKHY